MNTSWNPEAAGLKLPQHARVNMPDDANLVVTDQIKKLTYYAATAVDRGDIVLVSGAAGCGKSTMLAAVQGVSGVRVVNAEIPPRTRDKAIYQQLHQALWRAPEEGTVASLQDRIRAQLALEPTLVIVDEAQNVGLPFLMAMRWLNGATNFRFGLILAGVGLQKHIQREPQLSSRVAKRVLVEKVDFAAMLPQLRKFHPMLAEADEDVLRYVDQLYANGYWRAWSLFLQNVQDLFAEAVDGDIARAAITMNTDVAPRPFEEWLRDRGR